MKEKRRMLLAAVVFMLAVVACGNVSGKTGVMAEEAVPATSSHKLLTDGLEYLLSEEKEDVIQIPDTVAAEGDETIIYFGDGSSDTLVSETVMIEEKSPEILIDMLAGHNIVSLDTKVIDFTVEEDGKTLVLDLSAEFSEYLKTMGQTAENIIVASLAETFLENYDAEAIYLKVEGEPLKTRYAEYTEALSKSMPENL